MRTLTRVAVIVLVAAALLQSGVAEPRFWGDLKLGRYGVGFRVVPFAGGGLHVWYPAAGTRGRVLEFNDYLRLSPDMVGAPEGFPRDESAVRRTLSVAISGKEDGLTTAQQDLILHAQMEAQLNAPAASGKFPLVLWTHRYGTTAAQSVISEYLASHGFVVVYGAESTPPVMPFALKVASERKAELDRQVQRLQRTLVAARRLSFVRRGRVGLLAWSYAGESAYAMQQRERDVSVVVALSSNVLSGWVYRPEELASVRPETLSAPYVLLSEPRQDGSDTPNKELLNQSASPIFIVRLPRMKHGAFNALEGMVPATLGIQTVQRWSLAGPEAKLGYEVIGQYVRRALAHYLVALPTMDNPFALWAPDGEIPEGFATTESYGRPRAAPAQPTFVPVAFRSDDTLLVSADLYPVKEKRAPVVVLVHQSGASRGEYRQIAPRLKQMGFNALAIDSRWGRRDRWNGVWNETAKRYGTEAIVTSGDRARIQAIDREKDLRAAVRWLRQEGYSGPLILWGSSITANGVLKVAALGEERVNGLLAFSPGEYNPDNKTEMQAQVKNLRLPLLIACGEDEDQLCGEIFRSVPEGRKRYYHATRGRHGSSILLDDPENWRPVEQFLEQFRIGMPD